MISKLSCLAFFSCIFVTSLGRTHNQEEGTISFTPQEAIRCWSSSPTLYAPFSMLELDLSKASTSIQHNINKLMLKIDEYCEMGRYAAPCIRACDIYKDNLARAYPISVPLRKFDFQEYYKKYEDDGACYRVYTERTEADYLGQKLTHRKVIAEEKVNPSYCRRTHENL